jgi:large exoprotein involved in heme utilization and adhesion
MFLYAALNEQDIGGQLALAVAQGREWLISGEVGLGLESRWSNGIVADVTAGVRLDSTGLTLGPQKVTLGNAAVVGLKFKY